MDKKELNASKLKPFRHEVQSLITKKLPLWQGLLLSIILVTLAIKIQFIMQPKVGTVIFIAMYPVILLMSWLGGAYSGFFTLFLCIFSAIYFFILPNVTPLDGFIDTPNLIRMCLFTFTNIMVVIIVDRLRKAEEKSTSLFNKVSESDTQYRAIVELSPHIIWYSDADGDTTYLNHTWQEYTGFDARDTNSWIKALHPDDFDSVTEAWNTCIKNLSRYEMHIRLKRHDGEYRWFFARGKPILTADGSVSRWIGKAVDFHEQKLAIDSKNEFISLASHELKTPLTSLSLQLQILDRNVKNKNESILNFESLEKLSKVSLAQIDQINHLIEDMLNVSRISEGKIPYQMSTIDLDDVIENATQIVASQYMDAKVPLTIKSSDKVVVSADQRKLVQVLVNLLINALKYGNGTPVSIAVSKNQDEQKVKIEVVDAGNGILKENHEKIFERFVQISSNGKNAGLGLGLYLSKEIILAHSGSIFVDSELEKGSCFIIELPLINAL